MALRVSTTGSDVPLLDLGITITHPTSNRDLALEFTSVELRDSEDLTSAIQAGDLSADDGDYFISAEDYDPDELLLQQLNLRGDTKYMSFDELLSTGDTYITSGVFPLALNSTAAISKNVYAPAAKWITWELEDGDLVTISGNAAVGEYTVATVVDQQNFTTIEDILDSTGGTISMYHPPGATRIGVDESNFGVLIGDDLQEVLEDIDSRFTASGFEDQLVKVSANDTTAGYLNGKITVASGLQLTEQNDGGNESLEISLTEPGGSGGQRAIALSWGTNSTAHIYAYSSGSWNVMARIIFPGTTHMGADVQSIKAIAWVNVSSRPMSFRIYDVTNSQVIAEANNITSEEPILLDFTDIDNASSACACWEVQGYKSGVPASYIYMSAMTIFFGD